MHAACRYLAQQLLRNTPGGGRIQEARSKATQNAAHRSAKASSLHAAARLWEASTPNRRGCTCEQHGRPSDGRGQPARGNWPSAVPSNCTVLSCVRRERFLTGQLKDEARSQAAPLCPETRNARCPPPGAHHPDGHSRCEPLPLFPYSPPPPPQPQPSAAPPHAPTSRGSLQDQLTVTTARQRRHLLRVRSSARSAPRPARLSRPAPRRAPYLRVARSHVGLSWGGAAGSCVLVSGSSDGPYGRALVVGGVRRVRRSCCGSCALGYVRPGGARARGCARRAPLLRAGCWPAGSVLVRRPRAGLPPAGGGSSSAGHSAGLGWWQRALATWCRLAAPRRSQHFMLFLEAWAYVASSLIRRVQCWQLSESDLWTESSNRWQHLLNLKRHLRDERVSAFALVTRGGWVLSVASPRCWVVQLRLLPAARSGLTAGLIGVLTSSQAAHQASEVVADEAPEETCFCW